MIILVHHETHHEFGDLANPAIRPFSVKVLLTYEFISLDRFAASVRFLQQ